MRQLKIATQITNRDSQAVEKYLQEISKIPMITPEEETTLAQRIKMAHRNPVDAQRALDKLVQANLRFVVSVAKQYQHQGLSLSDLINEGNLGLIKAAQRFDETKGFKFIFIRCMVDSPVHFASVGRAGQISPPASKQNWHVQQG
jgi:RNA polymerase primary sigma factor